MRERASFLLLLLLSILLIVMGFEGSLGKVLAALLTPSILVINQ